jgi:hypothetical protein
MEKTFVQLKEAAKLVGVSVPTAKKMAIECGAYHHVSDGVVRVELEPLYDFIRSK